MYYKSVQNKYLFLESIQNDLKLKVDCEETCPQYLSQIFWQLEFYLNLTHPQPLFPS
jgi:hypothetical protein